jgi:cytochrome P450
MNVVGVQRNPRYWPQSPDEFMPERWLPPMNDKIDRSEEVRSLLYRILFVFGNSLATSFGGSGD